MKSFVKAEDKTFKLGDAIAKLAKTFHLSHCAKCERRRLILNEIQKVGIKETLRRLRTAGLDKSSKNQKKSIEEIINKLTDCCKE
ncbi:MAG: hypothetical protein AAB861_00830 [Patescibacteria group bacterium]